MDEWLWRVRFRLSEAFETSIDWIRGGPTKREIATLKLEARCARDAGKKLLAENRDLTDRVERLEAFIMGLP